MGFDTSIPVQPTIETDRFVLRPLRLSDCGLMTLYAGDLRVARMTTSLPHPLPPGAAEAYVRASNGSARPETAWAMDASGQGGAELMGVISLDPVGRGRCEIGYWVAPPFWNTRVASDAVEALVAANPLGCETLFASVFQDNPASARVLVHAGFEYVGDAEAYCVARAATVQTWTYLRAA